MGFAARHLLGIEDLSREEIEGLLESSRSFKEVLRRDIKKVPAMRGKTVVNLFYEASTRTRTSFEIAGKRLSADVINVSVSTSSVVKGESLLDTARNIEALNPDVIVVRHSSSGAPHFLARSVQCSVVNAGDGSHEHPTQALLDAFTMLEHGKKLEGLKVAIIGDVAHSRVARSNIHLLGKMGAEIRLAGPSTLMPRGVERLPVQIFSCMEDALAEADVVMMLRIQMERQGKGYFPSLREYSRFYGLTSARLALAKEDALVMHPGPMNRGIEISADVADGPRSVIMDQVTNGLAVRMAVLFLVSGGSKE
ncbi:MAG: aspartate carbamoyltransferase catalytic subunit [Nitrospirota bacterium]|nr:aspartate carbamoyltransferase catalytic subunit [Nitrospirota bacterium]